MMNGPDWLEVVVGRMMMFPLEKYSRVGNTNKTNAIRFPGCFDWKMCSKTTETHICIYIYNYTTFYVYAFQVCYDRSKSCTKQEIQLITTQSS